VDAGAPAIRPTLVGLLEVDVPAVENAIPPEPPDRVRLPRRQPHHDVATSPGLPGQPPGADLVDGGVTTTTPVLAENPPVRVTRRQPQPQTMLVVGGDPSDLQKRDPTATPGPPQHHLARCEPHRPPLPRPSPAFRARSGI